MSNPGRSLVRKPIQKILLWLSTFASLVFFGWTWLLFLPINILGKMTPLFDWLGEFLPGPGVAILFFLLLAVTYLGGVYGFTRLHYSISKKILHRSVPVFVLFTVISILLWSLLWPVPCDSRESFIEIPNRQCDCAGWSFEFYPIFVMDASTTSFCMGWEIPVEGSP